MKLSSVSEPAGKRGVAGASGDYTENASLCAAGEEERAAAIYQPESSGSCGFAGIEFLRVTAS